MNLFWYFKMPGIMVFKIDKALDAMVLNAVKSGVNSLKSKGQYYCVAELKDGSIFTFWNVNRYHGWLSNGKFEFTNGDTYEYKDARPTRKAMYKFSKILQSYASTNNHHHSVQA